MADGGAGAGALEYANHRGSRTRQSRTILDLVSRKTAKALGVTVPLSLLARADEVFQ